MKTRTSKTTSPRGARKQWLEWEDGMIMHCRALITLAELLMQSDEQGLETELVGDAGALIAREARQLKKLLQTRPGRKAAR